MLSLVKEINEEDKSPPSSSSFHSPVTIDPHCDLCSGGRCLYECPGHPGPHNSLWKLQNLETTNTFAFLPANEVFVLKVLTSFVIMLLFPQGRLLSNCTQGAPSHLFPEQAWACAWLTHVCGFRLLWLPGGLWRGGVPFPCLYSPLQGIVTAAHRCRLSSFQRALRNTFLSVLRNS